MKCSACSRTMKVLGSAVTDNETTLRTHYLCACGKRALRVEPNPRYVPAVKVVEPPPRRYTFHTSEPVRWCCRCGEAIRVEADSRAVDGLCGLCAADVANGARP